MALAAAGNQHPAAARNSVVCIKYMPAVLEKHLQPGGELHGYLAQGGMPNSKTAAAVRGQAPVLTANLLALLDGKPLHAAYDGYSCCPLITGYCKTIIAKFNYKAEPTPSFPLDPTKERWSMWFVKCKILPSLYWNRMLAGAQYERQFVPGSRLS